MFFSISLFAEKQYIIAYKQGIMSIRSEVNSLQSVTTLKSLNANTDVIKADEIDIDIIKDMAQVDYIEEDKVLKISETWGLDRIDAREGLDDSYEPIGNGEGVHAYVIDTGINTKHEEFEGRIGEGFSSIKKGGIEDCNAHGTHVSSTVGGTKYGVAKKVTIHPVRVLDCKGSGYTSGVVEGVQWVADHHKKPAVANMSLGGGVSRTLDIAVKDAIKKGVTFVVAAGNENRDACKGSPSGVKEAITVGASDADDERAYFSNYGDCVDIFAPGVQIMGAWKGNKDAYKEISGTSMASPAVAGAAAIYLGMENGATTKEVERWIKKKATKEIIGDAESKLNDLLYVGPEKGKPRPEPKPEPEEPKKKLCDRLSKFWKWVFRCSK
jgi:subtilisin family serine protease